MVENLQREDLNPIEEADGYQRLISELGYTQESLATRVGKDRTTITNALRLLRLPEEVRDLVVGGRVSMGHARALLGLESADAMVRLARRIAAREMSVRQVEALVRREREQGGASDGSAARRRRRTDATVGVGPRSGRAAVARHRRARQGRRDRPGARAPRAALPLARRARHADRTPAPVMSHAGSPPDGRRNARVPVALELEYRSAGAFLVAYTTNLSKGGIFVETSTPLPMGHDGRDAAARAPLGGVRDARHGRLAAPESTGPGSQPGMGIVIDTTAEQYGAVVDEIAFSFTGIQILLGTGEAAPRAILSRYLRSILACRSSTSTSARGPRGCRTTSTSR